MADARSTTSGVGPSEPSQPAQVFESATRAPANLPAPVSQQLLLSEKPTRQKSHAGYGVRSSMVSDTRSNGGKFAIYNGGYTDQIDYKNVCKGSGGQPLLTWALPQTFIMTILRRATDVPRSQ